ncbi:unnamed protein product [Phytophthora lilii]|uniref:Unnamed protein product n=1 Tax=Phytophthora lilii TaxID=2077276 RepID=A0A9W6WLM6_9STRA|nr:unnamed protein product [Phytophthora lilii]
MQRRQKKTLTPAKATQWIGVDQIGIADQRFLKTYKTVNGQDQANVDSTEERVANLAKLDDLVDMKKVDDLIKTTKLDEVLQKYDTRKTLFNELFSLHPPTRKQFFSKIADFKEYQQIKSFWTGYLLRKSLQHDANEAKAVMRLRRGEN